MGKATCNLKVTCNEYLNTKNNSKNNLIATDKLLSIFQYIFENYL